MKVASWNRVEKSRHGRTLCTSSATLPAPLQSQRSGSAGAGSDNDGDDDDAAGAGAGSNDRCSLPNRMPSWWAPQRWAWDKAPIWCWSRNPGVDRPARMLVMVVGMRRMALKASELRITWPPPSSELPSMLTDVGRGRTKRGAFRADHRPGTLAQSRDTAIAAGFEARLDLAPLPPPLLLQFLLFPPR